jgi:predicted Zn-dependent protease
VEALAQVDAAIAKEEAPDKLLDLRLWRAFIVFEQSVEQGEGEYRALAAQHSQNPKPWAQLSSALLHGGFRERALVVADEGLVLLPDATKLLAAKAESLGALARPEEAEQLLEEKTRRSTAEDEALFSQLYRLQAQHGKRLEALQTLERGLWSCPVIVDT